MVICPLKYRLILHQFGLYTKFGIHPLPAIKGFFPVVDLRAYFKKHNIKFITDMWGHDHKAELLM